MSFESELPHRSLNKAKSDHFLEFPGVRREIAAREAWKISSEVESVERGDFPLQYFLTKIGSENRLATPSPLMNGL